MEARGADVLEGHKVSVAVLYDVAGVVGLHRNIYLPGKGVEDHDGAGESARASVMADLGAYRVRRSVYPCVYLAGDAQAGAVIGAGGYRHRVAFALADVVVGLQDRAAAEDIMELVEQHVFPGLVEFLGCGPSRSSRA